MPTPKTGQARIHVEASPELVYGMVADLPRMGEWSAECRAVEWVGEPGGAATGQAFRGHNQLGPYKWTMRGRVVVADPGREFAFATLEGDGDGTRWRYRFEHSGTGTDVVESYEVVNEPWYVRLANLVVPRGRLLQRGMQQTLERIKAAAEAAARP